MELEKRQDPPDDLARRVAVVEHVERVRPVRVIDERHRQVAAQRGGQESIDRIVQAWKLVAPGSGDEQRKAVRNIVDGLPGARVGESELGGGAGDRR